MKTLSTLANAALALALALAAFTPAFAAEAPAPSSTMSARTELELARSVIAAERQAVIASNLTLSQEQSKAFWPLYKAYRDEMTAQGDRMVELVNGYHRKMGASDADAKALLDGFVDVEMRRAEILAKHVQKMREVLPAPVVVRFVELEAKIDALVRTKMLELIDLVKL